MLISCLVWDTEIHRTACRPEEERAPRAPCFQHQGRRVSAVETNRHPYQHGAPPGAPACGAHGSALARFHALLPGRSSHKLESREKVQNETCFHYSKIPAFSKMWHCRPEFPKCTENSKDSITPARKRPAHPGRVAQAAGAFAVHQRLWIRLPVRVRTAGSRVTVPFHISISLSLPPSPLKKPNKLILE